MYNCEVCGSPSPPKRQRTIYKGVALCQSCVDTVLRLEKQGPAPPRRDVCALVAEAIIASFELQPGSLPISWPR